MGRARRRILALVAISAALAAGIVRYFQRGGNDPIVEQQIEEVKIEPTTESIVGKWRCVSIGGKTLPENHLEIISEFYPDRTWLFSIRSRKNGLDQSSGTYFVKDRKIFLNRNEDGLAEKESWSLDVITHTDRTLTIGFLSSEESFHLHTRLETNR